MASVVILQDTWTEEDDIELIEYLQLHFPEQIKTLTETEILEQTPTNMIALFCDTSITQIVLSKIGYKVPDTYETCFKSLYKRTIQAMSFKDCREHPRPFFIKPFDNDKSFCARMIEQQRHIDFMASNVSDDTMVYVSEPVKFVNEYRLFLSNDGIRGIVNSSRFVLKDEDNELYKIEPPKEFIDQIIQLNNIGFCVVDVALTSDNQWMVVEVNPPFAISSYEWPIHDYVTYCIDALKFVNLSFAPVSNETK
jgi:hypothetical protein